MITRHLREAGSVAHFRAKWAAEAEGFTIRDLNIHAEGEEVIYTATATKEEDPC